MFELLWKAHFLVQLCILVLLGMSVLSWGFSLMAWHTLRSALRRLKKRWQEVKPHSGGQYNPWVSIASHALQKQLNFIATVAKLAPYVGLLGTVFGMMDALKGLAQASSMPIQQLAPGIAEALITTALGLLVAIPAMLFHQLLGQLMQELEDYLVLESGRR